MKFAIGIDIGSITISLVKVNQNKEIVATGYRFHHGKIPETLVNMLDDMDVSTIDWVACTSSTPDGIRHHVRYDSRVAIIAACRHFHQSVGSILLVGGEKFGLIRFDENGNYLNFKANTSCAAGTGSFLDQQARRLNLSGIEELTTVAYENEGAIPKIASRCAVFAKTDLIHAQQEGYSLPEICDGLCHGLAKNIVDTLFTGEKAHSPIIFVGGVAKNRSVVHHINDLIGEELIIEKTHYSAAGAAFQLLDELAGHDPIRLQTSQDILLPRDEKKEYFFEPLQLKLTDYPDFKGMESYEYKELFPENPVEVDIYRELENGKVYLGVDIGSTSTKAVLTDIADNVLAGFYTRTAGQPVAAMQNLLAAIDNMIRRKSWELRIVGAGTTGSGRKFVGKIIGADMMIDEITAHARAAYQLNPKIDTIIEIGGQDSKFTTLQNGRVTFSVMNTVCAAGTGSFIEEQAKRLDCSLSEYADRTENQCSPLASDRCTVFMERDVNHHLANNYAREEVLASTLHSIRENYLTKVAVEGSIGEVVCFQGATAKNRMLIAAFEQRLKKPIYVSRYCHITGALGVALMLADEKVKKTSFKGITLYKKPIPIRSEVCELCNNNCKITVADVRNESVAFGFLCGRDYETQKRVNNNKSGFDLLKERTKIFASKQKKKKRPVIIGLPAALHVQSEMPFWKKFFHELAIKTVTSERLQGAIGEGKKLAKSEFCAPMSALHGHVEFLRDKADYILLPFYLDQKSSEKNIRRQYCYYTQFAPSVISSTDKSLDHKLLTPMIKYLYSSFHTKSQLYQTLKPIAEISFLEISNAFDKACQFVEDGNKKIKQVYAKQSNKGKNIHVVLLGRPYTVLARNMNKGIPDIFAALGIKAFFQDMLEYSDEDLAEVKPLLDEFHWYFSAEIIKATAKVAQTEGAYPVLITSFKCSPDSLTLDYFKMIMEGYDKPYLILQLDEHDSSVGYETRIEAAIRSFENHHKSSNKPTKPKFSEALIPKREETLEDKVLLFPNWDNIALPLVVANLKREGIDARLLQEDDSTIQKSLRHNTGQCLPLNIIGQEFIDYVEKHNLDPAKTALWMMPSVISCNIGMYPHYLKSIFAAHGKGMEKAGIYTSPITFVQISMRFALDIYFAYMFGGMLKKMGCKIRPYEKIKGATDAAIQQSIKVLSQAFLGEKYKEQAVVECVDILQDVEIEKPAIPRPQVAILGDMYARDNEAMNQRLIHFIEENGGEVITTPYSSYAKMISKPYFRKWFFERKYLDILSTKAMMGTVNLLEKRYYKHFAKILQEPNHYFNDSPQDILSPYNVGTEHSGETLDNLLKIYYLSKYYPSLSLFVQAAPAFCCPSMVTESMAEEIEKNTGVPFVSITYDGTGGNKNEVIIPYLKYPRNKKKDVTELTGA